MYKYMIKKNRTRREKRWKEIKKKTVKSISYVFSQYLIFLQITLEKAGNPHLEKFLSTHMPFLPYIRNGYLDNFEQE